jgi:superoxide dismutase, Fe-Mn family
MIYELPPLAFSFDSLEPFIDTETVRIHYSKHHQAYTDKLNTVLQKYPVLADQNLASLLKDLPGLSMDEADKQAFRNNAGGYLNHNLYWSVMGPDKQPDDTLINSIEASFGSLEQFKQLFSDLALNHFGSGWAWLVKNEKSQLEAYSLPNQDSPYQKNHTPLICLDVWEHAYYLKYQNKRADYIKNWWNVLKLF